MMPLRSNIHATAPAAPMLPPPFSNTCRISGAVRLRLSVITWTRTATPPGAYPSYVISSYDSPGNSPVPFWMARLTFSAGMFASLADSTAALRRMLIFGSPPPFLAATVISRRILENSLPRCTSALPFLRLICDHRECPDIALSSFFRLECRAQPFHPLRPQRTPHRGSVPAPPLRRGLRRERGHGNRAPGRSTIRATRAEVDEGQERRARVPDLAGPRTLGQDLDPDFERRGAHVVQS